MYLIICLIANNLCVFVNSGQYPSCGAPISAVVFPVLCGKYCSLMRKVLQYFSESTGVLTGQYWEKNRRCHPFLSGRHRRHFSTYPMILLMRVAQDETKCSGIDQLLVRDGKAFQLLVAGCYLLDIDIFRFLMLGLDDQFPFRVVTLVELDRHLVEGRRGQHEIHVARTSGQASRRSPRWTLFPYPRCPARRSERYDSRSSTTRLPVFAYAMPHP